MKKSTKIFFAFCGLAVLLLVIPLLMHYSARARLAAYKRKLLAGGEKLAISDLAPIPNLQGQSNAVALLQVASNLTRTTDFRPNGMKIVKPGRARVAWRRAELIEEVDPPGIYTNVWPLMRAARTNNEDALKTIRGILSTQNIQFPINYEQPDSDFFSNMVDHFKIGKNLAVNAGAEVILDLRDGRTNEAMENLLLGAVVPKLCIGESLMISQLVGYAEEAIAIAPCWEFLQRKGWTDDQLGQLQEEWAALDFLSAAASSLAMERAREPRSFDLARRFRDPSALSGFGKDSQVPKDTLHYALQEISSYTRPWIWSEFWSYDDERLYMQLFQDMIDATRAAQNRQAVLGRLTGRDIDITLFDILRPEDAQVKYPIAEFERSLVPKCVENALRAQTLDEIVTAAIALERYALRHQKYPDHLGDLVPLFLKRVPVDYMDGKDLRYRLRPDASYLLYSVGQDGVDDGGDPTPPADRSDWLHGRDWVWPAVATEEEVRAYESNEAKEVERRLAKRRKPGDQK